MKLNLTEERKKAALEAGKQGMKNAYEKSKYRPGLTWWERLLWVVLALSLIHIYSAAGHGLPSKGDASRYWADLLWTVYWCCLLYTSRCV